MEESRFLTQEFSHFFQWGLSNDMWINDFYRLLAPKHIHKLRPSEANIIISWDRDDFQLLCQETSQQMPDFSDCYQALVCLASRETGLASEPLQKMRGLSS